MFKWYKGKKSKGGSYILEYSKRRSDKDLPGLQEDIDTNLVMAREKIFKDLFVESGNVSHELLPLVPHIDVYIHPPGFQVQLLHLTPITTAECTLKLDAGMDALYDLFDENNHSPIFKEKRESYIKS